MEFKGIREKREAGGYGPKTAALKDVGPQAHFRTLTPPKYQAAKTVTLEERLEDFIEWLRKEKEVELMLWTSSQSRRLTYEEMSDLIEEYVNT